MRRNLIPILTAALSLISATETFAQEQAATDTPPPRPFGSLSRALIGDQLEKENGIAIIGWADATALGATNTGPDGDLGNGAFFTQDEGFTLNELGVMICKGDGCPPPVFGPKHNNISRIGPFPGPPRGDDFDVGYNVTAVIGSDSQFFRATGFDDFSGDVDEEIQLSIPQAYVDVYVPVLDGVSVVVGNFFTPNSGLEIGLPFNPPNWFSTHTYALQHGPARHTGLYASAKIPTPADFGLLTVDAGLVTGWNNFDNVRATYLGAIRYRSPTLATWIDAEVIVGDGEDDFVGPTGGGSPYLAISTTGEELLRLNSSLTATHQLTGRLQLAAELDYGFQEGGDDIGVPVAITQDSAWYGANIGARSKVKDNLHVAGRAEWFRDENAANILWSSRGASGGNVFSLTGALEWQPTPQLRIRPEVRFDSYNGGGNGIFGDGEDDQLLGLVNVNVVF